MFPVEDSGAKKLNHKILVINVQIEFELHFYLEFNMPVSIVK